LNNTLNPNLLNELAEARRREKAQTLFYRALAAQAELEGEAAAAERLNELHADEQHHLSRLTARVLELGGHPENLPGGLHEEQLEGWEDRAREREAEEIRFYSDFVAQDDLDEHTAAILQEILESERQHHRHLGGKWMPA
jgi:rubrerythrin